MKLVNWLGTLNDLEAANGLDWQEYWESIASGTSGSLSIPDGHEILLDQWYDGVDAVVSKTAGGIPTGELALDAGGDPVTTTLNAAGAWAFSAAPTAYPVAIVFAARGVGGDLALGDYTETLKASTTTGDTTIDLANGSVQRWILDAARQFTMPADPGAYGKSFVLVLEPATYAVTWNSSPPIKWLTSNGAAPTLVTAVNLVNVVTFTWDAIDSRWLGFLGGTETA